MKRYLVVVLASLTLLAVMNARAAATWTNPESTVLSLFACTLNPGQTQTDVWRVLERNAAITSSIEGYSSYAFMWLPMRGRSGFDYIFGFISKDLATSVDSLEKYIAGPGQKMGPEFGKLGKCSSGIYDVTGVRPGKVQTGDDRKLDAIVEFYSCQYNPGKTRSDFDAAVRAWNKGVDGLQSKVMREDYDAVVAEPMWGGIESHDLFWAGNFPSLQGMAESSDAMMANADARQGLELLNAVSDCESSLWTAYWLNGPKG